nr:topoisomerase C-terminal repeat-containing protein [Geobacillus sp. JS12]
MKKLLSQGKTNVIKGFKKGGKTFDAALVWDGNEKKLSFQFSKR